MALDLVKAIHFNPLTHIAFEFETEKDVMQFIQKYVPNKVEFGIRHNPPTLLFKAKDLEYTIRIEER